MGIAFRLKAAFLQTFEDLGEDRLAVFNLLTALIRPLV